MMLRTICLRNPGPEISQTDSLGRASGRRVMACTVRMVSSTTVPVFWKAAKSWRPVSTAAAASMAGKSSGPTAQTKGRRWGSR